VPFSTPFPEHPKDRKTGFLRQNREVFDGSYRFHDSKYIEI